MIIEQELTASQLAEAYASGQRRFRAIELVGDTEFPSLSGMDLSHAEFTACWFHSATFSDVDLGLAVFSNCNLKCATFERCDLRGSKWENCFVCSLAFSACETTEFQARALEAYGIEFRSCSDFLEYAISNGQEQP